jgi:hypothetical protein
MIYFVLLKKIAQNHNKMTKLNHQQKKQTFRLKEILLGENFLPLTSRAFSKFLAKVKSKKQRELPFNSEQLLQKIKERAS